MRAILSAVDCRRGAASRDQPPGGSPLPSVNLLVALSGLILDRPRQWRALALSLMAATALGGIGFLLLPAEVGYAATEYTAAGWAPWFEFKRWLVGNPRGYFR